jgi:hypothetical protein
MAAAMPAQVSASDGTGRFGPRDAGVAHADARASAKVTAARDEENVIFCGIPRGLPRDGEKSLRNERSCHCARRKKVPKETPTPRNPFRS